MSIPVPVVMFTFTDLGSAKAIFFSIAQRNGSIPKKLAQRGRSRNQDLTPATRRHGEQQSGPRIYANGANQRETQFKAVRKKS
jgi:hypothetical protein